jgi:hypothetical protein
MDIKTLLSKDSIELEKLTTKELVEYFAPYMVFIKPIKDEEKTDRPKAQRFDINNEARKSLDMAQKLAQQLGIKI